MTKSGRAASLMLAGLGMTPSVHRLRLDAPDALWRSVQKVIRQTDFSLVGQPGSGGISSLHCIDTILSSHRSFLDGVDNCALIMA